MPHHPSYRPDIDGLRAIAILLVVVYHYFGVLGGYIGVDIFFVISGYLITRQIVLGLESKTFSIASFYAKRVRRILPALAFVICACLLYGWFYVFPTDYALLAKHGMAGIFNVANLTLWSESGYFDTASHRKPFLHFWSLGIEEQFYLVWPILLILFFKIKKHLPMCVLGITLGSFFVNVIFTESDRTFAFYMPFSRFWELSAGGLVAIISLRVEETSKLKTRFQWAHWIRIGYVQWFGLLLILLATALLNHKSAFPGYWALLPVLGTCCLIYTNAAHTRGLGFLKTKPIRWVGNISFGIYLWHWPVLLLMHLSDYKSRPYKFVALAISVLLAWLSYKLIEQPFRTIPVNQKTTPRFLWAGFVATLMIGGVSWAIYSGQLKRSWDETLISKNYQMQHIGCGVFANHGKEFNPDFFARCDKQQFPNNPKVVMLGDSHALNLHQGLQPYLEEKQIDLLSYPVLECTPLSFKDKRPVCVQYNTWIVERIKQIKPDLVLIFAHHLFRIKDPYYGEHHPYPDHLWTQAEKLKSEGIPNVMIIGGIPNWVDSLPHALNFNFLRKGQPVPERTHTYLVPESLAIDSLFLSQEKTKGIEFFSLKDNLCNDLGCLTHIGPNWPQDLIVMDYGHLTQNGAKYVSEIALGQKISKLISHRE